VHRVGFYTILICFEHALKLMHPSTAWIFLIVPESMYEGLVGRKYLLVPPCVSWDDCTDSYGNICLDPRYLSG
jgi:hypothetical protein